MQALHHKAREWLGTPYLHQGRSKQVGCDCIGLVIGVLHEIGVTYGGQSLFDIDENDYSMQPDGRRLLKALNNYLKPEKLNILEANQILLMRFEKEPQHVGIVGSQTYGSETCHTLIHCYQSVGKVVEHHLDDKWKRRIVASFSLA